MCVCVCGGRGHSVPHFMELFLIPLGASIGYLRVCGRARGLLFQLGRPALCVVQSGIMALGEGRSSSLCCGSLGRASITEHTLSLCLCKDVWVNKSPCVCVSVCVCSSVHRAPTVTLSGLPQWHVSQGESLWIRQRLLRFSASSASSPAPPATRLIPPQRQLSYGTVCTQMRMRR